MNTRTRRHAELQRLCRYYLRKLKPKARKYGLSEFVEDMIQRNKREQCASTDKEVEMLARICNDERVPRADIPQMLGLSYRQCVDKGEFEKIKKLNRTGIYSKVSALIRKRELHG